MGPWRPLDGEDSCTIAGQGRQNHGQEGDIPLLTSQAPIRWDLHMVAVDDNREEGGQQERVNRGRRGSVFVKGERLQARTRGSPG